MHFEQISQGGKLRLHKYMYYLEKSMVVFFTSAFVIGVVLIFLEGWNMGSTIYNHASKTVDICNQGKSMLQNSKHLSITCERAKEQLSKIPILFGMEYTIKTILDYTVYLVCQIGASWLSTIATSGILALILAYLYHKVNGPQNVYTTMLHRRYQTPNMPSFMYPSNDLCTMSNANEFHPLRLEESQSYYKNHSGAHSILNQLEESKKLKKIN